MWTLTLPSPSKPLKRSLIPSVKTSLSWLVTQQVWTSCCEKRRGVSTWAYVWALMLTVVDVWQLSSTEAGFQRWFNEERQRVKRAHGSTVLNPLRSHIATDRTLTFVCVGGVPLLLLFTFLWTPQLPWTHKKSSFKLNKVWWHHLMCWSLIQTLVTLLLLVLVSYGFL